MRVNREDVRALAALQGLVIPEGDLDSIALRLSAWLGAMDDIEREMGPLMNQTEPIAPIFPREEIDEW